MWADVLNRSLYISISTSGSAYGINLKGKYDFEILKGKEIVEGDRYSIQKKGRG